MRKFTLLGMKLVSCLSLLLTINTVNAACFMILHQPEVPQSVQRFRK